MGPKQVFSCGTASGASTSSALDLGTRGFTSVFFNAVTMSTGAAITVLGSQDGTTFYPVNERVNTAPVQYQTLTVATTTSGTWVQLPNVSLRYLQFTTSAVVSGGVSYHVAVQ